MNLFKPTIIIIQLIFISVGLTYAQDLSYYFPKDIRFKHNIPSPADFFKSPSGSQHIRYDQVLHYFNELARLSDRVEIDTIGYSWENRPLVVLKISSKSNLANQQNIQKKHIQSIDPYVESGNKPNATDPALVFLGFTVHGNETSAADAALLVAYYLAAGEGPILEGYLQNAIFFVDAVRNPDGYDRYVNWVNANRTYPAVADPLDREHTETWPGGRTNHYWFDLNRDWINQVHPESKARIHYFQSWLPHVQGDFHEMFASSTYFFEPTKPDAQESQWVPKSTYALNNVFANYYAKSLDEIGSLYYTKEQFDNINPTYGSSYPDHAGSLGILFEQASPRGLVQSTASGLLTYPFAIRNHVRIALATIQASVENKQKLQDNQVYFFKSALQLAAKDPIKAYIVDTKYQPRAERHFKELLQRHKIDYFQNTEDRTVDNFRYTKGESIVIPTNQANYRLIKVIFDEAKEYVDSVFYDGSGNSLAYLYGFQYAGVKSPIVNNNNADHQLVQEQQKLKQSSYAYIIDWRQDGAAWVLAQLLQKNIRVKTSTSPFSLKEGSQNIDFDYGSLLIPIGIQDISQNDLYTILNDLSTTGAIDIVPVTTGYSAAGVDLGSSSFKTLKPQRTLLLTGNGVNAYEAGEIWYAFEQQLGQNIVRVNVENFGRINLDDYQVLVLASGEYGDWSKGQIDKVQNWVKNGGTLIAIGRAGQALTKLGIASFKFQNENLTPKEEDAKPRFAYASSRGREGVKRIGGTYFNTEIDQTHPIGYGYNKPNKPVFRNHALFVELGSQPYNNVAIYTKSPLLNGYVSPGNLKKITGTSSIIVENVGAGRVVFFVDNPVFRGLSYGNARAFYNAIFFGQIL